MSLLHFFLAPSGRISRQAFWLGLIVLFAVSVPVSLLIDPAAFDAVPSTPSKPGLSAAAKVPSLLETLWSLVLTWPSTAISIKRFNDRDRPRWIGCLLGLVLTLLCVANGFGLMLDPDTMSPPEKIVFAVVLSFVTWALIDNGFYKGTDGANRYGPDPLPRSVPARTD